MIQDFDFMVLDFIQSNIRNIFLDKIMPFITYLGSGGLIWIFVALLLIFIKKYRLCGIEMITGLLTGLLIGNIILKNLVMRERPCWINESIDMLISVPKDYSFPSGHTMSGFCCAVILFCFDKRIGIPAIILASIIAFSRLYLYVHFPTDILAGGIIGCIIAFLVVFSFNKIKAGRKKL
ncbi:MAG: phosphatase PAP2 family protein [Ruminococcus callidus]|nr:phosphatase PAP2 family protein [Ruminococcus callidus]